MKPVEYVIYIKDIHIFLKPTQMIYEEKKIVEINLSEKMSNAF